MARIVGVNALVLFANDPAALAQWYEKRLGITTIENADDGNFYGEIDDYHTGLTFQFAIFKAAAPLGVEARGAMLTYRVDDYDVFVGGLERAGIAVERSAEKYGRFARLRDPEGNLIELFAPFAAPVIDLHRHEPGHPHE
jgi:catechol 2,3-dioxygenase-like lactoylglutathione lyase family enzyme